MCDCLESRDDSGKGDQFFFLEAMSLELFDKHIMGLQGNLKVPNQQLMEVKIFQDPSRIQKEPSEVGITS